jgi:hypothetical protein
MTTDVFLFANAPYPAVDVVLRPSVPAGEVVPPVAAPSLFTRTLPVVSVRPDDDDLAVALALVVA